MSRTLKRLLKVLAIATGAFAVLFMILAIFVLSRLPSASMIQKTVQSLRQASEPNGLYRESGTSHTDTPPVPVAQVAETSATPSPRSKESSSESEDHRIQKKINSYFLSRYLDQNDTQPKVCINLRQAEWSDVNGFKGIARELGRVADGQKPGDSFVESFFAPIGVMIARPATRSILDEIRDTIDSHGDPESLLSKAAFYSKLAAAAADLTLHKQELESAARRSYYLYVLSRAVHAQPQVLSDPRTSQLCDLLESGITTNSQAPTIDPEEEKKALEGFLNEAGISNEEVGYDPSLPTSISIDFSKKGLHVRIPWMEKMIATDVPTQGHGG